MMSRLARPRSSPASASPRTSAAAAGTDKSAGRRSRVFRRARRRANRFRRRRETTPDTPSSNCSQSSRPLRSDAISAGPSDGRRQTGRAKPDGDRFPRCNPAFARSMAVDAIAEADSLAQMTPPVPRLRDLARFRHSAGEIGNQRETGRRQGYRLASRAQTGREQDPSAANGTRAKPTSFWQRTPLLAKDAQTRSTAATAPEMTVCVGAFTAAMATALACCAIAAATSCSDAAMDGHGAARLAAPPSTLRALRSGEFHLPG